jgi:hypothetical protein
MTIGLHDGAIDVEVKAPHCDPPKTQIWYGDDSSKIAKCLKWANGQFHEGRPNLLVLVPTLRIPVYSHRSQITGLIAELGFGWDVVSAS